MTPESFALALLELVVSSFGPAQIEEVLSLVLGDQLSPKLLDDMGEVIASVLRTILDVLEPDRVKKELMTRYKADDAIIAAEFRAKFGQSL